MKLVLMILLLGFGLSGCGQKGPLYLPQSQQPSAADATDVPKRPETSATKAPESDEAAAQ